MFTTTTTAASMRTRSNINKQESIFEPATSESLGFATTTNMISIKPALSQRLSKNKHKESTTINLFSTTTSSALSQINTNDIPNIVDDEQSLDKTENADSSSSSSSSSSSNKKKISSVMISGNQDDLNNSLDSKDKRRHYLIKSKDFLHIGKTS
jgi:hypothetical protein